MSTLNLARGLLQRVFAGKVIAHFRRNDVLRASRFNEIVDCLNPFLSMEVKRGSSDNVIIGPNKVVLQLSDSGAAIGGGGNVGMFRLKSVQDDYLTCRTWDGVSDGGTDIYIAKEPKLRTSLASATIYGVVHTYTYSAGPDTPNLLRTNTWPTAQTEDELVTPAWIINDIIFAISATTDVVDGSSNPVVWLRIGDSRQWAKKP